ncbi:Kef-type K+ transport system NAD-binding protein [Bifidobacterium cuniculi]|uniref:Kef-type K+ transport system NAD-binding protein n=1 Tax=Bifidobacterium cuniculi TaxID=1688 RepID=A0A087ANA2_9BIFI|nr:potassium channel family protein [Bifidobacterium cuniculi]KFI60252.1 Kef-type K+ transport system NAD-binding protein [Bifidobacterium cuniculi]
MTIEKWDRLTNVPLFILSVLFLAAYSWQILKGTYLTACFVIINVVWAIYGIDYLVSLFLAPDKWKWFKQNLILLVTLILPVFRPLRLLRFVAMLQIFNRSTGSATRGRITMYATCAVTLLIYVGALAEYSAEHTAPGATITSFPLALWWAFVTVTTVGYGDVCPVTPEGRCVAVGLMMTGIALIGIVSAMISSWIIDQVDARSSVQAAKTQQQTQYNSAETRLMRAEILRLADSVSQLNTELQRTHRITRRHGVTSDTDDPSDADGPLMSIIDQVRAAGAATAATAEAVAGVAPATTGGTAQAAATSTTQSDGSAAATSPASGTPAARDTAAKPHRHTDVSGAHDHRGTAGGHPHAQGAAATAHAQHAATANEAAIGAQGFRPKPPRTRGPHRHPSLGRCKPPSANRGL